MVRRHESAPLNGDRGVVLIARRAKAAAMVHAVDNKKKKLLKEAQRVRGRQEDNLLWNLMTDRQKHKSQGNESIH